MKGLFDDGWLGPFTSFDVTGAQKFSVHVYLPRTAPFNHDKQVFLMLGTLEHLVSVPRDTQFCIGPFDLQGRDTRVAIVCTTSEPKAGADQRNLGLLLDRIELDGVSISAVELYGKDGTLHLDRQTASPLPGKEPDAPAPQLETPQ